MYCSLVRCALIVLLTLLAGCGGTPPLATQAPPKASYQVNLGSGIELEFKVEFKISAINGKSCYAFFSGVITNHSGQPITRKSVLDFTIASKGQTLFRNITYPLADIPPGKQAGFDIFSSPLHRDGCPPYEQINVSLR